jgi:DNA-directed RNA polymerase subunit E'/Rpb7
MYVIHITQPERQRMMVGGESVCVCVLYCNTLVVVGRVVQVGFDHIGIVVHGAFSVSIPASNIRSEFTRDTTQDRFRSSASDLVIEVGSFVKFVVTSYGVCTSNTHSQTTGKRAPDKVDSSMRYRCHLLIAP